MSCKSDKAFIYLNKKIADPPNRFCIAETNWPEVKQSVKENKSSSQELDLESNKNAHRKNLYLQNKMLADNL